MFPCLWWCVWMRLTFESVDWGKKIILPNVGGHYPVSQSCCSNRTTGNSSCLTSLIWDISFFLTWMTATPMALLVLRPLVWNCLSVLGLHQLGILHQDLGILSLHNCMSQFLTINIWSFLIKHTHIFFVVHFFLREKIFFF